MLVGGALWSLGNACADLAHLGIVTEPGRVPAVSFLAVAGSAARGVGWYTVTIGVPMYYPDGQLGGGRWRWLPRLLVVVLVGAVVGPLTDPQADIIGLGDWRNPIAPTGAWTVISGVAFLVSAPLSLVVIGLVVARLVSLWRHGDAFRRQQLSLLAAATGACVVAAPIAFVTQAGWIFGVAALPVPFAIGFAVLARGLYDLRTAVNRTLLWITLSAVVVGVYAVVMAGVGAVLHVGDVPWLPWVAAAAVAIAFAPLRDGLQRAVNRLTYGRWDEPYDVLAGLGQRLEASADVDRLLADVAAELQSLGLRDVIIVDDESGPPGTTDDQVVVPLAAYGRPVGSLLYRRPEPPLRARDVRLLDDLAGLLGGVLHAHRLTADLQRARESLVLAREEERRRLRRDLHDGLGPALAGHLLRLDVLAGRIGPQSPARADVDALRDDLRATVLEVRRVVEGLRPPAVDELGLAGALEQATQRLTTGSGTAVELRVGELPPLPAAVEVAAYRIVTEAVTNVVRHAAATHCTVDVSVVGRSLRIGISDDGRGLPSPLPRGNGLQTMRERAEELRGRLRVTSDQGVTVVAELPLPSARRPVTPLAVTGVAR
jgi:signal transduction histidine kinase